MASLSASLGVSEMFGAPLGSAARSVQAPSAGAANTGAAKVVALFGKKKAAPAKAKPVAVSPASEELAKWYGK